MREDYAKWGKGVTENKALRQWVENQVGQGAEVTPLTGDASFRTYFRAKKEEKTWVVMWAPPAKEKTDIFVHLARTWKTQGLPVPAVWAWEQSQGFVLLSDFGDRLLFDCLHIETVDAFYQKAIELIFQIQLLPQEALPAFDAAHMRLELGYFKEWFLEKLLKIEIAPLEKALENFFDKIIQAILSQPQVVIHRDYHSRNLMVLENSQLGLLDFQDAMKGPIAYDLVSLIKDCYIDWPPEKIAQWIKLFCEYQALDPALVSQWVDWVGLQRHLKVLGIFARLNLRDAKTHYMQYLPRIMHYVLAMVARYPDLAEWETWFHQLLSRLPQSGEVTQCEPLF